jgi:Flp pilus assembly protein TadG
MRALDPSFHTSSARCHLPEPVRSRAGHATPAARSRSRGQVLVIFALSITVLMGMVAVVIDVTWYWANSLRVQRAADAAALAGVIYLPGNVTTGVSTARTEASKNGYANGSSGAQCSNTSIQNITVTPQQDLPNLRRMKVTLSAPVSMFFMRLLGIDCIQATRVSKAEFVLPVPMGSPLNYYGNFGTIRKPSGSPTVVTGPSGEAMNAQGFWGTMLTTGADIINGDAYLPKYSSGSASPQQNTANYYDYAVLVPGGSTANVFIYDPVFCATDDGGAYGTGDRWFNGSAAVNSYFRLYNMHTTPYDLTDDTEIATSGTFFTNQRSVDSSLGGSGGSGSCKQGDITNQNDARYWHDRWWQLAGSLSGSGADGTMYRLRTTTASNDGADAQNSFAIYVQGSGDTPRVYGLGAMEMFSPLSASTNSTFYMAQIDQASGAGKTMEITLWDPGDTSSLSATLSILKPTSSGYTPVSFSYSANRVASGGSSCNSYSGTNVSSVQTNTGGSSRFNGCWVTIDVAIPADYTAPTPPGEPGAGWWKIKYAMGSGSVSAFDLTTWQVNILGNPVHLVVP